MRPTCEAGLLIIDGVVEYTSLVVYGAEISDELDPCGKPAVDRQKAIGEGLNIVLHEAAVEFNTKYPPLHLCAEHWDEWMVLRNEAAERYKAKMLNNICSPPSDDSVFKRFPAGEEV